MPHLDVTFLNVGCPYELPQSRITYTAPGQGGDFKKMTIAQRKAWWKHFSDICANLDPRFPLFVFCDANATMGSLVSQQVSSHVAEFQEDLRKLTKPTCRVPLPIAENRADGEKRLARFPRSLMTLKLQQLIQDHAYASLLNGHPVVSFKADSAWFLRCKEDHGFSVRKANRKYAVPRNVVKERMEIFWVNLFRIRHFIPLTFGTIPRF